eukprot:TRINITY_DN16318_c0_g1_i1.p1 TRINITY_DN16318_c0_g1~~TRINITY_DN16318_c0_g1_i1.p1  ORF type:complete len:193 (-),score=22.20 TRINITY_DN16318_c0_g1_i1:186-764(-)
MRITNINNNNGNKKLDEIINNNNIYQIIFFETYDDDCIYPPKTSEVIAFCPFTKIHSRGGSIKEALGNWMDEASYRFGFPFTTPSLRSRKVWCNEFKDDDDKKHPVYVIDYQFAHSDKVVVFLPDTSSWLQSSDENWFSLLPRLFEEKEREEEKDQKDISQKMSSWFDDRFLCSDVMVFNKATLRKETIKLI